MEHPVEAWLASEDDDKFAAAMMKCQDPSGRCAEDGRCRWDGDCFRLSATARRDAAKAIRAIQAVSDSEVRAWLDGAAGWIEAQIEHQPD